jgi:nucleoside-diphosphate-sugar epimerase
MNVLVLGGTVFVGRAVVDLALERGDRVTVLHRGLHGEDLFSGQVERVLGDRRTDLDRVSARTWDLVVDTCGFAAEDAHVFDTGRYAFVSSCSVYTDWPERPVDLGSPVKDPGHEDAYGAGKAALERALEDLMPGRVLHARAGLILGPHENIGRLPRWLRRAARGGEMLAPGPRDAPIQFIDVRDLARLLLDHPPGVVNATARPGFATWGELVDAVVAGTDATPVWVDGAAVAERVDFPWGELPIWPAPLAEMAATYAVSADVSVRPLVETVEDTRAWLDAGGTLSDWREEVAATGLSAGAEAALLAELR